MFQLTSFDRVNSDSAKIRGVLLFAYWFFGLNIKNEIFLSSEFLFFSVAIEKSVVSWVNDSDVPFCPDCGNKFNIRNRRHHCRLCGSIMCRRCMEFVPLPLARMHQKASEVQTSALRWDQRGLISRCLSSCYREAHLRDSGGSVCPWKSRPDPDSPCWRWQQWYGLAQRQYQQLEQCYLNAGGKG